MRWHHTTPDRRLSSLTYLQPLPTLPVTILILLSVILSDAAVSENGRKTRIEARVKAMTREVQKRRANLALSSDLRTGKGNGHGAAVSSLTAVVVEALTIFL